MQHGFKFFNNRVEPLHDLADIVNGHFWALIRMGTLQGHFRGHYRDTSGSVPDALSVNRVTVTDFTMAGHFSRA